MSYSYINEMLHLLFLRSNQNPDVFISFFNSSSRLIAYNYSFQENRFTHISDSFSNILGFKNKNFIVNGSFSDRLIHPQDVGTFRNYINKMPVKVKKNGSNETNPFIVSVKCRARHIKGFWKYFIFFSQDYWCCRKNGYNKIGLIMDEHVGQDIRVMTGNNGNTVINNISTTRTVKNLVHHPGDHTVTISFRENEILELIGQGWIAKEIAGKLNISTNTVITHRKNLIKKLNVKNTAELIKKASQLMLI